ncbi:hypothetical protein PPERSA_02513 [Pseudocohnilembus persalinus]|uniref:Uncharacterized protein n=1 Tax=Pseudocohnilembus persalinus TaxID=266149 RepID=A0A0V0QAZ7_PSEPJ|nr:hypothetical protein PPERSA_02513 [Pseudocohnilembus persalinus]|eukprot:KRW99401.1 hypothetical protein PPERSA_02513 [Pseudocohnilembus persalinus]
MYYYAQDIYLLTGSDFLATVENFFPPLQSYYLEYILNSFIEIVQTGLNEASEALFETYYYYYYYYKGFLCPYPLLVFVVFIFFFFLIVFLLFLSFSLSNC